MERAFLPRQDVAIRDASDRTTTPFYVWMQSIETMLAGGATLEQIEAALAELRELIAEIPTSGFLPDSTQVVGRRSVFSIGTLAGGMVQLMLLNDVEDPGNTYYYGTGQDGTKGWFTIASALAVDPRLTMTVGADGIVTFDLAELADSGAGALLAITRDAYGRVSGTKDATITGTSGQIEVANGDAVAGLPTLSLADVPDGGGGTLQKTAFDAKGRKTDTSAATTDDLTEGATNLYFTAARVRATLLDGISFASAAVITAADSVLSALGKLQAQITALASSLTGYVPTSRTLTAGVGLDGGGDLSADRTFDLGAASQASLALADSSVQPGDAATSLNMATDRLLGRSAAGSGAVEEISIGANLTLAAGVLSASGGGGSGTVTSVDIDDATGISFSGGPITGSGSFTPTLSANLQAWHGLATSAKQDSDADLTAIAGANPAANQGIYWTGAGAVSTYSLTAGGRALGGVAGTANTAAYFSAANTVSLQAVSASGRNLWNIGGTVGGVAYLSATNTWSLTMTSSYGLGLLNAASLLSVVGDAPLHYALKGTGFGSDPAFGTLDTSDISDIASGTYTPTITNVTNVTASTSNGAQYLRVGNTVTVSGSVDIDPTAAAATTIRISLPIASDFATNHDCAGTMASGNGEVGPVFANIANDNAQVQFTATNTANHTFYYQFTYRII